MAPKAPGRRIKNKSEACELLKAWQASGERMTDWCQARGLNWYSLCAYRRRNSRPTVATTTSFVELTTASIVLAPMEDEVEFQSPKSERGRYRIHLRNDLAIEVDDHFREATLLRLIRVAASC